MNFQILNNLQTTDDLESLKEAVEQLLAKSSTANPPAGGSTTSFDPEKQLPKELVEAVRRMDGKPSEWLRELLVKLDQMPRMRLVVAIELPQTAIDRISRMVKQHLGPEVVLDVVVDDGLVGGAEVEFQGKYYDGSLKKKLREYFSKNSPS